MSPALWTTFGVCLVWSVLFGLMAREEIADWWHCRQARANRKAK